MARGGRRPGAGRPFGSKDSIHRKGEKRKLVERAAADATQYLQTNDLKIFDGDGIALMISVYKNEELPLNIRIQCAMAASPFERPRLNAVAGRFTVEQTGSGFGDDDPGDALIASILRRVEVAKKKHVPAPEVVPPPPTPARHAPRAPIVDGESAQQACDMAEKPEQSQPHKPRYADKQEAQRDSPPQPERAKDEPAATGAEVVTMMVPTRGVGGRIRWIPRG
jgi:hypothetical protein